MGMKSLPHARVPSLPAPWWNPFLHVNLLRRRYIDLLTRHIETLRDAVRSIRRKHPFDIHNWVVLPDHLHCVDQFPEGDDNFTLRLRLIKARFSKPLPRPEQIRWITPTNMRRNTLRYCALRGLPSSNLASRMVLLV